MSFEFPNPENKLDKNNTDAISKARLELEESQKPEKSELDIMRETQEEIAKEVAEIGEGILLKFPPQVRKYVLMAVAGVSLFFAGINKAEAGGHNRPHHEEPRGDQGIDFGGIVRDALERAAEDIIDETKDEVLNQGRRDDRRWEDDRQHHPDQNWRHNKEKIYREKIDAINLRRQQLAYDYRNARNTADSREAMRAAREHYEREMSKLDAYENELRREYYGRH